MHTKSALGHIVDVGRQGDHPILLVALDRQAIQQIGLAVRANAAPAFKEPFAHSLYERCCSICKFSVATTVMYTWPK